MLKLFLSWLLLCSLTTLLASPLLLSLSKPADQHHLTSHHVDGKPCPHGHDHDPSAGGCLCLCCPVHAKALFTAADAVLTDAAQPERHRLGPTAVVHPEGISVRIFRPPRV